MPFETSAVTCWQTHEFDEGVLRELRQLRLRNVVVRDLQEPRSEAGVLDLGSVVFVGLNEDCKGQLWLHGRDVCPVYETQSAGRVERFCVVANSA